MPVKELVWLQLDVVLLAIVLLTVMATGAQQQQEEPSPSIPSSASPLASPSLPPSAAPPSPLPSDDLRRSSGESAEDGDDQLTMITLLPSEGEGLVLATGQTAILECRVSAPAAINKSLSWIDTSTNAKMTNDYTTFQNTTLIQSTSVDDNVTSLILTISNLTVAKSEFRCELDADDIRGMQRTVKVTVINADSFCTFEGETVCAWKLGNVFTHRHSTSGIIDPPASCAAEFSDHTYGRNNSNGNFLIARVAGDQQPDAATLNATLRNTTKCICFYYRTCINNDSKGGGGVVQLMVTMNSMSPLLFSLPPTFDWTKYSVNVPLQTQEQRQQQEVMMSFTYTNASDYVYVAIDDIRLEDDDCDSDNQQMTKMESMSESRTLLQAPTFAITTTKTVLTATTKSSQGSTSEEADAAAISKLSSSTTTSTTQPSSSATPTTTTTAPTTTTTASSSSLPPTTTTAMIAPTAVPLPRLTSVLSATAKRTPDRNEDSIRPTNGDRSSVGGGGGAGASLGAGGSSSALAEEEGETDDANDDASAAAAAASAGDNSTGLAIGIILAIMVAGACTAAILYRRRKNGKKSTYITFGNPSYSREHLPVNDFGLDSPLTLSSNGYTVLA